MKNYDVVLFDLDGTLTDSAAGIIKSVAYALDKWGIQDYDYDQLLEFVGPPLHDSFVKYFGLSQAESYEIVDMYREYYKAKGIFENIVYTGIPALLADLQAAGKTILLSTSKPEIFARQILKYYDLDKYFTYIAGANLDGTRVKKAEVVAYALESAAITNVENAVLVGDREYDIFGARENGMDSIAVTYGYGSPEELATAKPDFTVDNVGEIAQILLAK